MPDKPLSQVASEQQNQIREKYLKVLKKKKGDEYVNNLQHFLVQTRDKETQRQLTAEFVSLPFEMQKEYMQHMARISDFEYRVKAHIYASYPQIHSDSRGFGSHLPNVLSLLSEKEVPAQYVRAYISTIEIQPSFTSHPTHTLRSEYTIQSMKFDRLIAAPKTNQRDVLIEDQIGRMIDIEPVAEYSGQNNGKKTTRQEAQEILSYMENSYHAVVDIKGRVDRDLESAGYGEVKLRKDFFKPYVWLAGDGDGNSNATADALKENMTLLKDEIRRLYIKDLGKIKEALKGIDGGEKLIAEIQNKLSKGQYPDSAAFIEDLNIVKNQLSPENNDLDDLILKVEIFGFKYAKIDLRHNAKDINAAVVEILVLLERVDVNDQKKFLEDLNSKDAELVQKRTDFLSSQISKLSDDDLRKMQSQVANLSQVSQRIFTRMQVMAENPEFCSKFIIADSQKTFDGLAALYLTKISSKSLDQVTNLNPVILLESAEDLMNVEQILENMFASEAFRDHIKFMGYACVMIARSDVVRGDGITAQFTQEEAVGKMFRKFDELIERYELQNVTLKTFNGGGGSPQRGGCSLHEVPSAYGFPISRHIKWSPQSSSSSFRGNKDDQSEENSLRPVSTSPMFTLQSDQIGVLTCGAGAAGFYGSFFSEALYACLKVNEVVSDEQVAVPQFMSNSEHDSQAEEVPNFFAQLSREWREVFFRAGNQVYKTDMAKGSPINKLLYKTLWASSKVANVSSRADAKTAKDGSAPILTKRFFNGTESDALAQRAIGWEKLCGHAKNFLGTWYSFLEGTKELVKQYDGDKTVLRVMSEHCKASRDTNRAVMVTLGMFDSQFNWEMLIGEPMPSIEEIQRLNEQFLSTDIGDDHPDFDKITLSHIIMTAIETAQNVYYMMTGKEFVSPENTNQLDSMREMLREIWPLVAEEIDDNEERTWLGSGVESHYTQQINRMELDDPINPEILTILRIAGAECDKANIPLSIQNTLTRVIGKTTFVGERELSVFDSPRSSGRNVSGAPLGENQADLSAGI